MRIKTGVSIKKLQPSMNLVQTVLASLEAKWMLIQAGKGEDIWEFIITSGDDGKHMATSKHYSGNAIDVALRVVGTETKPTQWEAKMKSLSTEIKRLLGNDFDIVYHKAHIHIEYDPK